MELLIPSICETFDIEVQPEEVERSNITTIMSNIHARHPHARYATITFYSSYTFDNYVYDIDIRDITVDDKVYSFGEDQVYIHISNSSMRTFTCKTKEIVFDLHADYFRNEEGEMIKFFHYRFF